MKSIRLISRAVIYPIMNFWFSISAQLCCKIQLLSLWVHLNAIPTFVIVVNLSWHSTFQDTNTNPASSRIIKETWRYMPSFLIPNWWMWHCVLKKMTRSWFIDDFQDEIFHESPMIFHDEYLIWSIRNSFMFLYISWLGCIHPSILY